MPVLEYFSLKKGKAKAKTPTPPVIQTTTTEPSAGGTTSTAGANVEAEKIAADGAKSPVLNQEEEEALQRIISEETTPPPLPARPVPVSNDGATTKGKDAQVALMDGADKVPLPTSPAEGEGKKEKKDYWSFLPSVPQGLILKAKERTKDYRSDDKDKSKSKEKGKEKEKTKEETSKTKDVKKDKQAAADTLASAAAAVKTNSNSNSAAEAKAEEEDLTKILDQLNLAAVNNRVFSFSKESEELMDKFKLVLKDLINGVPTAYNDLETLLKNSSGQLEKMFIALPPFLQTLVKSLPTKIGATLGPEFLAAASEKPGFDMKTAKAYAAAGSAAKTKYKRTAVPSLKKLVSQQGAVAGMLRSIMSFLKLRFPAVVTGTNVLLSLALFLLLFVFWYCHKRGRETRLERERLAAEAGEGSSAAAAAAGAASGDSSDIEITDVEESTILEKPAETASAAQLAGTEPPITIHDDPASGDKPSAAVADLPSVLDLPSPGAAATGTTPEVEKELVADPAPAKNEVKKS